MFNATLIVFRETLEAALFVGIIAAATRQLPGRGRLLGTGILAGILGAVIMALLAGRIAALANGLGQDLVNVCILVVALVMLFWHCVWVSTRGREQATSARQLGARVVDGRRKPVALMVAVALAILREGAETVLFVAGAAVGSTEADATSLLLACALGLACGVLTGLLVYQGLSRVPASRLFAVTNVLIALLTASIASQLARALGQAGLVDRWTAQVWDTSGFVAGDSAFGTVLHALVGYDARPSGLQVGAYLGVLLLIYVGTRFVGAARIRRPRPVVAA